MLCRNGEKVYLETLNRVWDNFKLDLSKQICMSQQLGAGTRKDQELQDENGSVLETIRILFVMIIIMIIMILSLLYKMSWLIRKVKYNYFKKLLTDIYVITDIYIYIYYGTSRYKFM